MYKREEIARHYTLHGSSAIAPTDQYSPKFTTRESGTDCTVWLGTEWRGGLIWSDTQMRIFKNAVKNPRPFSRKESARGTTDYQDDKNRILGLVMEIIFQSLWTHWSILSVSASVRVRVRVRVQAGVFEHNTRVWGRSSVSSTHALRFPPLKMRYWQSYLGDCFSWVVWCWLVDIVWYYKFFNPTFDMEWLHHCVEHDQLEIKWVKRSSSSEISW